MKHSAQKLLSGLLSVLLTGVLMLPAAALGGEETASLNVGASAEFPAVFEGELSSDVSGQEPTEKSDSHSFYAQKGQIVSLLATWSVTGARQPKQTAEHGAEETDEETKAATAIPKLEVGIYSDRGEKLASGEGADGSLMLFFIPAYTGAYHLQPHLSADREEGVSYSLTVQTNAVKNSADISLPYEGKQLSSRYRYSADAFFGKGCNAFFASDMRLELYRFSLSALSVLSYKITSEQEDTHIRTFLIMPDGDACRIKEGQAGDGFLCGDAAEAFYTGEGYLIVASDAPYTLHMSVLSHEPLTVLPLEIPFSGTVTVPASSDLYEKEAWNALMREFPFASLFERKPVFFRLTGAEESSSVLTLCCRQESFSCLSFVNDAYGLSDRSFYPLQALSEYYSELSPTPYAYKSIIAQDGQSYLCYEGSAEELEITLTKEKTHDSSEFPEEKYHPKDVLPTVTLSSVYSDSVADDIPGIPFTHSTMCRVGWYQIHSEEGTRLYYAKDGVLTAPDEKGNYTVYAVLLCDYHFSDGSTREVSYRIPLGHFGVVHQFPFFPDVDIDRENTPLLLLLLFFAAAILFAGIWLLIRLLRKKRGVVGKAYMAKVKTNGHTEEIPKEESKEEAEKKRREDAE